MKRTIVATAAVMLAAAGSACPSAAAESGRYVAMGSSYAAGPGVGEPDPASGACERSLSNFARLVARRRRLDLRDVSCSGATTANILERGQHGFPAQIEAVTADTSLITVLVGGNDVDYVGDLLGLSCRDSGGGDCRAVAEHRVDERLAALPGRLAAVVAAVRRRAPRARLVLIGYLPAIPAFGPGDCAAVPLTPADAGRMRSVAVRLARAIGGVAATAHVPVVRSSLIGTGHDACSPKPWVAGFRPPREQGWTAPVPYHPNQAGMDAIAGELEAVLAKTGGR